MYLFSLVLCTSTFITQCYGLLFRQQLHGTTQGDELNLIGYLVGVIWLVVLFILAVGCYLIFVKYL